MRVLLTLMLGVLVVGVCWMMSEDRGGQNVKAVLSDHSEEQHVVAAQQVDIFPSHATRRTREVPPATLPAFAPSAEPFSFSEKKDDANSPDLRQARRLYKAHCAVCHGPDGKGNGVMSTYSDFPKIAAFDEQPYAAYPPDRLFLSIRSGQGNMPAFRSVLSARDIWELVSLIRDMQHSPQHNPLPTP